MTRAAHIAWARAWARAHLPERADRAVASFLHNLRLHPELCELAADLEERGTTLAAIEEE